MPTYADTHGNTGMPRKLKHIIQQPYKYTYIIKGTVRRFRNSLYIFQYLSQNCITIFSLNCFIADLFFSISSLVYFPTVLPICITYKEDEIINDYLYIIGLSL